MYVCMYHTYVPMYVCIYVCMNVCMYIRIYGCMDEYTYVCMHVYLSIHLSVVIYRALFFFLRHNHLMTDFFQKKSGEATRFKLICRLRRRISLATLRRYGRRGGWFINIFLRRIYFFKKISVMK
jgi:hypothetical protein